MLCISMLVVEVVDVVMLELFSVIVVVGDLLMI